MRAAPGLPVPHMGWNSLMPKIDGCAACGRGAERPLCISFTAMPPACASGTLASVQYGDELCAVVRRDNFRGVQFHPERSSAAGARILRNFLARCHAADPLHRSARRGLRAPAPGRFRRRDALPARRARTARALSSSWARPGCTWSTWTARATAPWAISKLVAALAAQHALRLQVGGGVRSAAVIEELLQQGVARVVIGSAAVEQA